MLGNSVSIIPVGRTFSLISLSFKSVYVSWLHETFFQSACLPVPLQCQSLNELSVKTSIHRFGDSVNSNIMSNFENVLPNTRQFHLNRPRFKLALTSFKLLVNLLLQYALHMI